MIKIYLCDDEKQAKLLRKLMRIQTSCMLVKNDYRLPNVEKDIRASADIVYKYCNKSISAELKKCKSFASMKEADVDKMNSLCDQSPVLQNALGSCCVIAGEEATIVLSELKKYDMLRDLQKALETGKNLILW